MLGRTEEEGDTYRVVSCAVNINNCSRIHVGGAADAKCHFARYNKGNSHATKST